MITILCDKAASVQGLSMYERLVEAQRDIRYFDLGNMEIAPCYACRGCEEKTYGRCVVRDDADIILPCLMRSSIIAVLTPIVFGGYSFQTKRVVDKFNLIGDRHYYYRNGELTKRLPPGTRYYVVGIHNGADRGEIKAFKQLVTETITIGSWEGKPIVIPDETDDFDNLIREMAGI